MVFVAPRKVTPSQAGPSSAKVTVTQPAAASAPTQQTLLAADTRYHPGRLNLYFLGICMTMGGTYIAWNLCLSAGLYSYMIMFVAMGLGYITFALCIAEVTSALPFAGGSFGIARCTLGFFPAFMIGCCETLEYVASVAVQVVCVGDIAKSAVPALEPYLPLVWLVFYVHVTVTQCIGGATLWLTAGTLGAFEFAVLIVYNFGVLDVVDFKANALNDDAMLMTGGLDGALYVFPFFAWFYLGVEALNLASDDATAPKKQIPVAQVAAVGTLFTMGVFTSLTSVAMPTNGGIAAFSTLFTPLDNGFVHIFGINSTTVPLMTIPSQYAGAYGLHWASSKLIHSMGASKLLPQWFSTTSARFGTPYVAITVSSVMGYATCLLVYYYPPSVVYLFPVTLLFAFSSYAGQCVGYISLKMNYPIAKQSEFKNPLGVFGAAYALCVWVVGIVAILGFQGHNGIELVFFVVLLGVLAIYYVLYARKRQTMSEEESKVLLVAHIARFNNKRRTRPTISKNTTNTRTHKSTKQTNVSVG